MRTVLLFACIIVSLPVFCQPRESISNIDRYKLLKLHYQNSSGEEGVSIFNFNENGVITKGLWYLLNGKRNSVNFYDVDDKGNITKKFRIFSDGLTSTTLYSYDQESRVTVESFRRSDGVEGNVKYYYDKNGRLERAVSVNAQGWFSGTVIYEYDDRDLLTGAVILNNDQQTGTIDYRYNEDGLLVSEHWDFGGAWDQTYQYEYDDFSDYENYDYTLSNAFLSEDSNYKIADETYSFSDNFKGFTYREYSNSMPERKIYFNIDSTVMTVTHLFYDGEKKLINSLRRYADGRSAVFSCSYNDGRKIIDKKAVFTDGYEITEHYDYDKNNRLKAAIWKNFDSWLSGEITFSYDDDKIVSGTFTGKNRGLKADIEFSYNAYDLLSSVNWNFSTGDFQRYGFDYCYVNEPAGMKKPGIRLLNQTEPGNEPVLFAPGIVCDGLDNRDIAMTPDGKEIYFCVSSDGFEFASILYSRLLDDIWTKPEIVPFARDPRYMYFEPCINSDGSKMLFLSNMPKDTAEIPGDEDIWCVDRVDDGWGIPYNLGSPVNTDDQEFFPSLTVDNTLYFTRSSDDQKGSFIYRSKYVNGKYTEPEKLPAQVNCGLDRFNAYVAKDESFVIVTSYIKEKMIGGYDYYIVFRDKDDTWSDPVNMGEKINSKTGAEWSPYISPDGRYFFFMSGRRLGDDERPGKLSYNFFQELNSGPKNGRCDTYWISTDFINTLKNNPGYK